MKGYNTQSEFPMTSLLDICTVHVIHSFLLICSLENSVTKIKEGFTRRYTHRLDSLLRRSLCAMPQWRGKFCLNAAISRCSEIQATQSMAEINAPGCSLVSRASALPPPPGCTGRMPLISGLACHPTMVQLAVHGWRKAGKGPGANQIEMESGLWRPLVRVRSIGCSQR